MSTLLTVREVAERCKVSAVTVRRLIHQGELPAKRFGRCIRIDEDALIKSLNRE